jgi:hypothetical protein
MPIYFRHFERRWINSRVRVVLNETVTTNSSELGKA